MLDFGHVSEKKTLVCSGRSHLVLRVQNHRYLDCNYLAQGENKNRHRRARKWSLLEEETLRKGVEQYVLSWCSCIIV
jgi:hypothetical protein